MFQKISLVLVFVVLISCANHSNNNEKIKESKWLLGKWTSQSEQGTLEETWKSLNDSTFKGTSYFIKGKDTLHNESIVLQQNQDSLYYKAKVAGQNNDESVSFSMKSVQGKNVVFENLKHDYPQKINYKLVNATTLMITISGVQTGKPSSETFTLKKAE